MPLTPQKNGIHLFRLFGIDVYVHWLWLIVGVYAINNRRANYSSLAWNVGEYLALFLIVLLHEFGHALACKSVGGEANRIMLWPLGGVAFVKPPQRPGAVLWSIAAGPLVNVILAPIFFAVYYAMRNGLIPTTPDLRGFVGTLLVIDIFLFVFNMLPIYPLDGGQILQALLWFVIGQAKSLMVASVIGMVGAVAVIGLALYFQDLWFGMLAFFGIMQSVNGFRYAQQISRMNKLPKHEHIHCPRCGASPPAAPLWRCPCGMQFDTFVTHATCPQCASQFDSTLCPHCGVSSSIDSWVGVLPVSSVR